MKIKAQYNNESDQIPDYGIINEQGFYRCLFDASNDALLLVSIDTNQIVHANKTAMQLYSYAIADLLSMKITDLSKDPDGFSSCIKTYQKNPNSSVKKFINIHRKKSGEFFSQNGGCKREMRGLCQCLAVKS